LAALPGSADFNPLVLGAYERSTDLKSAIRQVGNLRCHAGFARGPAKFLFAGFILPLCSARIYGKFTPYE